MRRAGRDHGPPGAARPGQCRRSVDVQLRHPLWPTATAIRWTSEGASSRSGWPTRWTRPRRSARYLSLTGRLCAMSSPTTRSQAPNTVASAAGRRQPRAHERSGSRRRLRVARVGPGPGTRWAAGGAGRPIRPPWTVRHRRPLGTVRGRAVARRDCAHRVPPWRAPVGQPSGSSGSVDTAYLPVVEHVSGADQPAGTSLSTAQVTGS
jgi:hypothetical protein